MVFMTAASVEQDRKKKQLNKKRNLVLNGSVVSPSLQIATGSNYWLAHGQPVYIVRLYDRCYQLHIASVSSAWLAHGQPAYVRRY